MRFSLLLLAAVLATAAAGPGSTPKWPVSFSTTGYFSLPYAGLEEPFYVAVDGINGKQRIDFYNGLDFFIYRNDLHTPTTYSAFTRVSALDCVVSTQPAGQNISFTQFLPDLTAKGWKYLGIQLMNNLPVDHWQLVNPQGAKINTYDFYVFWETPDTPVPVSWSMLGYDVVMSSHFDQYILNYTSFLAGVAADSSAFDAPAACAGKTPSSSPQMSVSSLQFVLNSFPGGSFSAFQEHVTRHGRQYDSEEEEMRRFKIFHKNLAFVHGENRKHKSHQLHVNQFADMEFEEVKQLLFPKTGKLRNTGATYEHKAPADKSAIPSSIDWAAKGKLSAVKDQAFCGSCWAFSSTEAIESAYAIKYKRMVTLSPQMIVDCTWMGSDSNPINAGCGGGNQWAAFQLLAQNQWGLELASDYPYLGQNGYCHIDSSKFGVHITGYVNVTAGSEDALTSALAAVGPISVSMDVTQSLIFYGSGVFNDPTCKSDIADLDHAVLAFSYDVDAVSGLPYYGIRNSWSTHWGNQGNFLMIRQPGKDCGVSTAALYPIVA